MSIIQHSSNVTTMNSQVNKYVKLKRILPENALRHKMYLDGFSLQEIDEFVSSETLPSTQSRVVKASLNTRLAKFVKMRRILPENALRNKMHLEGFSDIEIDSFLYSARYEAVSVATAFVTSTSTANVVAGRRNLDKYLKMKRILPENALRNKMHIEGFTYDEINQFFLDETIASESSSATNNASFVENSLNSLNGRYSKYAKMKRLLPAHVVRRRMRVDGFSDLEIDRFISDEPVSLELASTSSTPNAVAVLDVEGSVVDRSFAARTDENIASDPLVDTVPERFQKYVIMKRILPANALKQKMFMAGFTIADVDYFVDGIPYPEGLKKGVCTPRRVYDKYVKMKRILPLNALKSRMRLDNLSDAEIDNFVNDAPLQSADGSYDADIVP